MALVLKRGGGSKPPVAIIYGKPGIGKTTIAACAPAPFFIQTEDGLTSPQLEWVPTFGVLSTYEQVQESFEYIFRNGAEQGWKTIVVDSIDRLFPLIVTYVCAKNGWQTLEDGAYGRGKVAFLDEVRNFMSMCMTLRNEANISIILLGHCKSVNVRPPDSEPYIQYSLAVQEDAARILVGDSDVVLFATQPIVTNSTDVGFKKKVTRAITQEPRLYTQERGAHVAKNRYNMPEWIPMQWPALAQYVPTWKAALPPELLAPVSNHTATTNGAA